MKMAARQYWSDRSEIYEEHELLFYRGRPVVPDMARERFLESIHRGHVGIQTGMRRAQRVWWPGMMAEVTSFVKRCHTCQASSDKQQREPMISFEIPTAPGLVIGSDFFDCGNHQYLIFVDLFSNWIEYYKVKTKDTKNLTNALRLYMARNGIPRVFTSDQGSAFTSNKFQEFCRKYGIKRADGSAKHERGNAHAEAAVKKIKKLLMRCKDEDELVRAMLAWHQTELAAGRPSPAQIHLGRNLRDELNWNVEQKTIQWEEVRQWRQKRNDKAKEYFDRGTKELVELTKGQKVFVRKGDEWKEGMIVEKLARPRSYKVRMEDGRELERNRVQIKENETSHSQKPKRPVIYNNPCPVQVVREEEGTQPVLWHRTAEGPDDFARGSAEHPREEPQRQDHGDGDGAERARDNGRSPVSEPQAGTGNEHGTDNGQREQHTEQSSEATSDLNEGPPGPRVKKKPRRLIEEM
jgi:transposase InsO family protein